MKVVLKNSFVVMLVFFHLPLHAAGRPSRLTVGGNSPVDGRVSRMSLDNFSAPSSQLVSGKAGEFGAKDFADQLQSTGEITTRPDETRTSLSAFTSAGKKTESTDFEVADSDEKTMFGRATGFVKKKFDKMAHEATDTKSRLTDFAKGAAKIAVEKTADATFGLTKRIGDAVDASGVGDRFSEVVDNVGFDGSRYHELPKELARAAKSYVVGKVVDKTAAVAVEHATGVSAAKTEAVLSTGRSLVRQAGREVSKAKRVGGNFLRGLVKDVGAEQEVAQVSEKVTAFKRALMRAAERARSRLLEPAEEVASAS
jgi:hypothetical protein